jgi:hypothetical protein
VVEEEESFDFVLCTSFEKDCTEQSISFAGCLRDYGICGISKVITKLKFGLMIGWEYVEREQYWK